MLVFCVCFGRGCLYLRHRSVLYIGFYSIVQGIGFGTHEARTPQQGIGLFLLRKVKIIYVRWIDLFQANKTNGNAFIFS
jgi:hypothetical protein